MERPLDDWDIFVLRHRRTPNILFHIVSFCLFWLSLPLAVATQDWRWVCGFFISGLVGTCGHYLFNDGTVDRKEASSSVQVVYFSSLMVLLFFAQRYTRQIHEAEQRFTRFSRGEISSLIDDDEISRKVGAFNIKRLKGIA